MHAWPLRGAAPPVACLLLLLLLLPATQLVAGQPTQQVAAGPRTKDACAGTDAKFRQLILYSLRSSSPEDVAALTGLWRRRLSECRGFIVSASSYGDHALTVKQAHFGFPPSRPLPANAAISDFVGWIDFNSLAALRQCLAANNATGTLAAMRAYAQPNARFDLVIDKNTLPGSKRYGPCPFSESYAPATVRYVFAYVLPPGANRTAVCRRGAGLWHGILKEADLDVRHGTGCSVLSDEEARSYGMGFNAGFGGYVDFVSLRDMTRYLNSRSPTINAKRSSLRSLASFAVRSAVALPWSGR